MDINNRILKNHPPSPVTGLLVRSYLYHKTRDSLCALVYSSTVGKKQVRIKFTMAILYIGMRNSCTSIFPNTRAWEQHNEINKETEEGFTTRRPITT